MADPKLFTPGPLTTSPSVKAAMLHDWGSRDGAFIDMTARVTDQLVALVDARASHECILVQGSGTFAVEAMLSTAIAPGAKTLVLANGAYGERIIEMFDYLGREAIVHRECETTAADVARLDAALKADRDIQFVCVVHCETTTGILNPLADIAGVVSAAGRHLIVDAMSSFGALPLSVDNVPFTALAASSNKCLQGAPGVGFSIIDKAHLKTCQGNSHSLSLDLFAQSKGFHANGQWRFTPPTHVLASLDQALTEHANEGGVPGRYRRYTENCRTLLEGMSGLGFQSALDAHAQAPIITTFLTPEDHRFDFDRFYRALATRGDLIYPGKLTNADTFRIGCIGDLDKRDITQLLAHIGDVLAEMGFENGRVSA
ncbi:MAG: 2-aminoethylphosphonate--pyruvate transaminase [Pseudomonadota bacterium]